MKKKHFPNIPRRFPAVLCIQVGFITLLSTLILINITLPFFYPHTQEDTLMKSLLRDPDNPTLHESLGRLFINYNSLAAQREYQLAEDFYVPASGSVSPISHLKEFMDEKRHIDDDTRFWKDLSHLHPDYFFSYLKLAENLYRVGRKSEGYSYLLEVKKEYPLSKNIRLIERFFQ